MIYIQGAAAVTHFGCLHFSPALDFVLSLLVVRLILSAYPEARDLKAFRLSGIRLPPSIGANQRSYRVLHFQIAQDAKQLSRHAVGCRGVARYARDLRRILWARLHALAGGLL